MVILISKLNATRKCLLHGRILAPPEGLRDPRSTLGFDPSGQEVIPRRFKRKKKFVTNGAGRTDRRHGRNSDVDVSLGPVSSSKLVTLCRF